MGRTDGASRGGASKTPCRYYKYKYIIYNKRILEKKRKFEMVRSPQIFQISFEKNYVCSKVPYGTKVSAGVLLDSVEMGFSEI